ncbi:MAG: sulfotransferase [Chromatiales bacterium]|nr:sulfotransferase [Chromatiales bacterium]
MMNAYVPSNYKIPVPSKAYFEKVHTVVSVSTLPRSGSTLLGYLLTAHRNMVVANEPAVKQENLYDALPLKALANYILYIDKMRLADAVESRLGVESRSVSLADNPTARAFNKRDRYIFVPNQWQGCCDSLEVIGIKNSFGMANSLLKQDVLRKFEYKVLKNGHFFEKKCKFKFIITMRNPYDLISTDLVYRMKNPNRPPLPRGEIPAINKAIKAFIERYESINRIFELMASNLILVSRHEDMVSNPTKQLTNICKFLKVSAPSDYLNDCASVVREKANKSRYELNWEQEQKERVAQVIEKYHFLSGYSWDS